MMGLCAAIAAVRRCCDPQGKGDWRHALAVLGSMLLVLGVFASVLRP
jgi:hypothetical protein